MQLCEKPYECTGGDISNVIRHNGTPLHKGNANAIISEPDRASDRAEVQKNHGRYDQGYADSQKKPAVKRMQDRVNEKAENLEEAKRKKKVKKTSSNDWSIFNEHGRSTKNTKNVEIPDAMYDEFLRYAHDQQVDSSDSDSA